VSGSFTAERWVPGSVCRSDSPKMLGNTNVLQEEIVLHCSTTGTAEVAAVQMQAYLWVGRGEE